MDDKARLHIPPLTVGVLGGMGPEATVDLLARIVRGTDAEDDADHIHTIVDNNPQVPSRIDYILHQRGDNPAPVLANMARGLEAQGARFLVMPCNTAHLYAAQIDESVLIPFVNMVQVVVDRVIENPDTARVGLLASTAVIQTNLYGGAFADTGVSVISPEVNLQDKIMSLIKRIKAGQQSDSDGELMREAADDLIRKGASVLVVACTELSAMAAALPVDVEVMDASQCLAEETIELAQGRKQL